MNTSLSRSQRLSAFTPLWLKRLLIKVLPQTWLIRLRGEEKSHVRIPWAVSREDPAALSLRRLEGKRPHLQRVIVHLCDHCNLNCRSCTHFSNICKPTFTDLASFTRDFERMAALFSQINEIYLLGGEPLLHPEVASFLRVARTCFPHADIELMTNGILLPRMKEEFWEAMAQNDILLDTDLYPIGPGKERITELAVAHQVRYEFKEYRDEVFFRLPLDPSGSQDPVQAFVACEHADITCPTLRDGLLYPCAYVAYCDAFKERFDLDGFEVSPADYRDIYQVTSGWELFDLLCAPIPWCRFCDFAHKEPISWEQASPKKARATDWLVTTPEVERQDRPGDLPAASESSR